MVSINVYTMICMCMRVYSISLEKSISDASWTFTDIDYINRLVLSSPLSSVSVSSLDGGNSIIRTFNRVNIRSIFFDQNTNRLFLSSKDYEGNCFTEPNNSLNNYYDLNLEKIDSMITETNTSYLIGIHNPLTTKLDLRRVDIDGPLINTSCILYEYQLTAAISRYYGRLVRRTKDFYYSFTLKASIHTVDYRGGSLNFTYTTNTNFVQLDIDYTDNDYVYVAFENGIKRMKLTASEQGTLIGRVTGINFTKISNMVTARITGIDIMIVTDSNNKIYMIDLYNDTLIADYGTTSTGASIYKENSISPRIRLSASFIYFALSTNTRELRLFNHNMSSYNCSNNSMYYDMDNDRCIRMNDIPDRYGVENLTYTIRRCTDINCLTCLYDYTKCDRCDPTVQEHYLNDTSSTCYSASKMKVVRTAYSTTLSTCTVQFDTNLHQDTNLWALDLYLTIQTGRLASNRSLDTNEYRIKLEKDSILVELLLTETIEKATLEIHNKIEERQTISHISDHSLHSMDGRSYFESYPIKVNDIGTIKVSSMVTGTATVTKYTVSSILGPAAMILMSSNPAAAVMLDKVMTTAFYQLSLNGRTVILPEVMLREFNGIEMLPFQVPDQLGDWAQDGEACSLNERLEKNGIWCNLISNYSMELMFIAANSLANGIVECLHIVWMIFLARQLNKKLEIVSKESELPEDNDKDAEYLKKVEGNLTTITIKKRLPAKYRRINSFLGGLRMSFGLRFAFMKLEGVEIEIISYCFMNIINAQATLRMTTGLSISLVVLCFYCMIGYHLFKGGRLAYSLVFGKKEKLNKVGVVEDADRSSLEPDSFSRLNLKNPRENNNESNDKTLDQSKETTKKEELKNSGEKKRRDLIDDVEFSSHMSKYFLVFFSQIAYPTKPLHSFIPFIMLMRSVLISISVFGLVSHPLIQVSVVMMIELCYMVIIIRYNSKNEVSERAIDIFNSVVNSLYIVLKFVTVFDIKDSMRQREFGLTMVVILIVGMLVNIMYVVYSLYAMFRDIIKSILKRNEETDEQKKERNEKQALYGVSTFQYNSTPARAPEPISNQQPISNAQPKEQKRPQISGQSSGASYTQSLPRRLRNQLGIRTIDEVRADIDRTLNAAKNKADEQRRLMGLAPSKIETKKNSLIKRNSIEGKKSSYPEAEAQKGQVGGEKPKQPLRFTQEGSRNQVRTIKLHPDYENAMKKYI